MKVLLKMSEKLQAKGYARILQLSSTAKIDVNRCFYLILNKLVGTRYHVIKIGINYTSNQSAALDVGHNDVLISDCKEKIVLLIYLVVAADYARTPSYIII